MEDEIKDSSLVISVMLAVTDAPAAVSWYQKALGLQSCGAWVQLQVWKLKERLSLLVNRPTMDGKARKNLVLHQHGLKYFAKILIHLLHGPYKPVLMAALIK